MNDSVFDNPKQVREYLDAIDEMAEYADDRLEKKVVTTPEACRHLIDSMDKSSEVILGLIAAM